MLGYGKILVTLAICCLWSTHAPAAPVSPGIPAAQREPMGSDSAQRPLPEWLQSIYAIADSDPGRARSMLDVLLADPRLSAQEHVVRHDAYALSTWLWIGAENYPMALASARRSVAADPEASRSWYTLATLEFDAGNPASAAKALSQSVTLRPDQVGTVDAGFVAQLIHQSGLAPEHKLELLQALTAAGWMQGRGQASSLWYELALLQVMNGDLGGARESAQRVTAPDHMVKLRSDRRFDPVVDRNSQKFDVGVAARNQVDVLQRLASAAPDSLELRNELTDAMLTAAMTDAALVHAELLLAKLAQLEQDDALFTDLDAKIWTMNNRAVALRRLGRPEEAIQQLEAASRLDEQGSPNVSQILNLSQAYCGMAQPDAARDALQRLGENLSPYGKMVKASTEHCIAVQGKDSLAASQAMDYLRTNRSFSQTLHLWALLESGQVDKAAAQFKELLDSPEHRATALGWAQQTREGPPQVGHIGTMANLKAMLARPEVRASIEQVGYIEQYPIFMGYMRD